MTHQEIKIGNKRAKVPRDYITKESAFTHASLIKFRESEDALVKEMYRQKVLYERVKFYVQNFGHGSYDALPLFNED